MRVTTTVFMMNLPYPGVEARESASVQAYVPVANNEIESRQFVSLYSGQNRIERIETDNGEDSSRVKAGAGSGIAGLSIVLVIATRQNHNLPRA